MTKYAQSTLFTRTALNKSLTTSSRSEYIAQSQNDHGANQGQNLQHDQRALSVSQLSAEPTQVQNKKRKRVRFDLVVATKVMVATLLFLGLSVCHAAQDENLTALDHDPYTLTLMDDNEKESFKSLVQRHMDTDLHDVLDRLNVPETTELSADELHYAILDDSQLDANNRKKYVMYPEVVLAQIDTLLQKYKNEKDPVNAAREQFAKDIEAEFQQKLDDLKALFTKKEMYANELQTKHQSYWNKLTETDKMNIKRYEGRVEDLNNMNFVLAKSHWGKANDEKKQFEIMEDKKGGIRQGHLNCLAIGLSHETSGFSMAYDSSAKKFEFIETAVDRCLIDSDLDDNAKQGQADRLSKLMDVGRGVCDFDQEEDYNKAYKGVKNIISKEDFEQRLTQLCKEYYDWSNKHKVPQEEMDLLLSNAHNDYMQYKDHKSKTHPKNYKVCKDEEGNDKYDMDSEGITYRMGRILGMLLAQNLDVITLVELDCYDFFAEVLRKFGYDGTFQEKAGQKGKDIPGHAFWLYRDGGAIFWRREKFEPELDKQCDCRMRMVKTSESGAKKKVNKDEKPSLKELNTNVHHNIYLGSCHGKQIAMDVTLKCTGKYDNDLKGKKFSIVTGHLKSGKLKKDQKKKAQIMEFVGERIKHLKQVWKHPVILSGDLNTPPNGKLKTLEHLEDILDAKQLQNGNKYVNAAHSDVDWRPLKWMNKNSLVTCEYVETIKDPEDPENSKKYTYKIKKTKKIGWSFAFKAEEHTVKLSDLYCIKSIYCDKELGIINNDVTNRKKRCKMNNIYPETYLTKFSMRLGGQQPHKLTWNSEVEDYLMCSKGMKSTSLMWFANDDDEFGFEDFAPTGLGDKQEYFRVTGGGPNGRLPSDHLMLATVWRFTGENVEDSGAAQSCGWQRTKHADSIALNSELEDTVNAPKNPGPRRGGRSKFMEENSIRMRRRSNAGKKHRNKSRKKLHIMKPLKEEERRRRLKERLQNM